MNTDKQIEKTVHEWSKEALLSKAQNYASIMHNQDYADWQFGFWSSLTLEILLRATLSHVSISLIADPKDFNNLLYAIQSKSIKKKFTPKSIDISEVLKRLESIFDNITPEITGFCSIHINRRNSEVHSGELPFLYLKTSEWLPMFYLVCGELCKCLEIQLDDLFEKTIAKEAKDMITDLHDENANAIKGLVNAHKTIWDNKSDDEKNQLIQQANILMNRHYGHRVTCPACNNTALVKGTAIGYVIKEIQDNEIIEKQTIKPSNFECVACGLKIMGYSKLRACKLGDTYLETSFYEPAEYFDIVVEPEYDGYLDDNNEFYVK